ALIDVANQGTAPVGNLVVAHGRQGLAFPKHGARRRQGQPGADGQDTGLARAASAGDAMHLARVQGEVEVIHDVDFLGAALVSAVMDGDAAELQGCGVVGCPDDGVGTCLQRLVLGFRGRRQLGFEVVSHLTTFVAIGIQQITASSPASPAQSAAYGARSSPSPRAPRTPKGSATVPTSAFSKK